ncbi:MAG: P1 family peptidase [Chloroflexi bacterium]|nr:P1 family peptidase [Chloroflexota bacterium]MBI5712650.1 P1 family peptidase [Chloroflexota bacterium]
MNNSITDIKGIRVGHAQNDEALTGCTVILCEGGAVGGIDQRGGAPGTRETDALHPMHLVEKVHAIMLAGGSAFGLDAASGAVKYLEERGVGFDVRVAKVPIVPAAILFDLGIGRADVRPDAAMGYESCLHASDGVTVEGNVGAGCGATVGKIFGITQAMKSGIGTSSMEIGAGVIVAAIVAVNAFGDVIDPQTNQIIAGARTIQKGPLRLGAADYFANTMDVMKGLVGRTILGFATRANTVIGVVATNADFSKEQTNKVAQMAHDGLARAIRPAHTMLDGDTIFALATGEKKADVNIVGAYAAEVFAQAIVRAVKAATPVAGLPCASHLTL